MNDQLLENGLVMTQEIPETIIKLRDSIKELEEYFNAGCEITTEQINEINLHSSKLDLFIGAMYSVNY